MGASEVSENGINLSIKLCANDHLLISTLSKHLK